MRLYSRTGAVSVAHGGRTYEPEGDGGFDFPEPVGQELHSFHVGGKPAWETQIERNNRLINEELERRQDPATLLDAVQQILDAAKATQPAAEPEPKPAPVKRAAKKTTASPKADSE
jgi:hypothetical protein